VLSGRQPTTDKFSGPLEFGYKQVLLNYGSTRELLSLTAGG
jgi:hypothetical protein